MSEMPGPEVEVKARAPAPPAPIAIPTAASSSSAWTTETSFSPVLASRRNRSEYAMKYSHSDDEGVIGYQATTLAPPITAPRAAAWLPSTSTLPSTLPVIASRRYGSCLEKLSCQWSYPTLIASRLIGTALGLARN